MTKEMALYTELVEGDRPLALAPHVVRLLAEGKPVPLARVAAAAGWPESKVRTVLYGFPRLDWDEHGRLVGLALTLRPTPHRFLVDGRELYGWCAMDTLLFPVMLGRTGRVESHCPVTAAPISMTVSPCGVTDLTPPTTVVAEVPPVTGAADLRSTVCDNGHFLATSQAAEAWSVGHPDGQVNSVASAFDRARARIAALGWAAGGEPMMPGRRVRARIEHVSECPLVERVRTRLQHALAATGITDVVIEDVEGAYPSPTLLVNGIDVVTGQPAGGEMSCRLDLPTTGQITRALQQGLTE